MNYRKLMSNRLSNLSCGGQDKSTAAVALLAGLAVGAVLGILFAPDSGKKTRERISDKALDLADNAKDGLYSLKDKINTGKDSIVGLKDRLVHNVKSKVDQTSQEFKDFRDAELEKVKSAADDFNNNIQNT
ncbi:YtxH domain-containing protein [Pedobacter frigoris]|nr:YtxH domain-containing protein [Pedobacter frigoris]